MFDDFAYDNYITESTDEGFFRAYNETSGQSADGATPEEAISTLAEEENKFFSDDEDFGSFDF
jgi:predicted RNase H-like HicB family nuclease